MMENGLKKAREIIDRVDREMASLFEQRMAAAELVAEYKRENGLEILDQKRENEIICRNSEYIPNEEIRTYYVNFLKDIMEISRAYQSRLIEGMRVAYTGTEGAFAHIATGKLFPSARRIGYKTFEDAYGAVVSGECDAAVLPLENSYNGEVGQVTDLMFQGSLYLNGMTELAVTQDLVGIPGTRPEDIKEVVSHPQALGQCADYIKKHGYTCSEYSNTALAAKYVSERGDRTVGAIASKEAAEIFGLEVIESNINASRSNTTKFAVFSRSEHRLPAGEGGVHSVILFTVRHEAGALAKAIEIIGKHGFNMQSLRSRPMKELLWQYYFYVEAEGNIHSESGAAMLKELSEYCDRLRVAGSFIRK